MKLMNAIMLRKRRSASTGRNCNECGEGFEREIQAGRFQANRPRARRMRTGWGFLAARSPVCRLISPGLNGAGTVLP